MAQTSTSHQSDWGKSVAGASKRAWLSCEMMLEWGITTGGGQRWGQELSLPSRFWCNSERTTSKAKERQGESEATSSISATSSPTTKYLQLHFGSLLILIHISSCFRHCVVADSDSNSNSNPASQSQPSLVLADRDNSKLEEDRQHHAQSSLHFPPRTQRPHLRNINALMVTAVNVS